MTKTYFVSYEPEADLLEVQFQRAGGYYHPIGDGTVLLRYDSNDRLIGFAIEGLSNLKDEISVELVEKAGEETPSDD